MKRTVIVSVFLLCLAVLPVSAADVDTASGARLDITSRTTFGLDLDNTYRYGLKNELTRFMLTYHLLGYQPLSSKVTSPDAVGFIEFTLFHLDLQLGETPKEDGVPAKNLGYNDPDEIFTNRYQTGAFIAGIAKDKWIFQLNAGANEPFWAPWNKGLQFVNDQIRISWAYLDTMVDVRRTNTVDALDPQGDVVTRFTMHSPVEGTDTLNLDITDALPDGSLNTVVGAMYNTDGFGLNLKAATELPYDSAAIERANANGLAFGIDTVVSPTDLAGLRVFTSAGGSLNWGPDGNSDPVMAGMKIGYDIPLNDDVSVEPYAGFDGQVNVLQSGSLAQKRYEVSAGLTIHWPGRGGWYTDYLWNDEGRVFPGMSIGYKYYNHTTDGKDPRHDVKLTLFEEKGDDGIFYGVGAEAVVELTDITAVELGGRRLLATTYLDYSKPGFMNGTGTLVPWTVICYDFLPDAYGGHNLKTNLGIKLVDGISNTTLGIEWNSGNLITEEEAPVLGFLKLSAEIRF